MTQENNTVKRVGKKSYNPTITAFFKADNFGMKDEEGNRIPNTAFVSANIDAKAYTEIQNHVQLGTKLLLRKAARLNKNGGETWYLEALPPLADNSKYKTRGDNNKNDDI
ncbi:MAG: hypothetical protein NVS1B10_03120 [Candidatus Saccharimonadales bacterium]